MKKDCPHRIEFELQRRRANALNVEPIQPMPRCKLKPPKHWGSPERACELAIRWLWSGGDGMVFGKCSGRCPLEKGVTAMTDELKAIEAGLTETQRGMLLVLFATGCPMWDLGGKWTEMGLVQENGLLTEKGKRLARRLALEDPEVEPAFKEQIRRGER
jgi:hypothetical protein